MSWLDLLALIIHSYGDDSGMFDKFLMLLWGLWLDRNAFIFPRKSAPPQLVHDRTMQQLTDLDASFWQTKSGYGYVLWD